MKIKCPNCRRTDFETTDKYSQDLQPNGSMIKCLLPYQIDFLCVSTTLASELTCPECLSPLVIKGRLNVVPPTVMEKEEAFEEKIEAMNNITPSEQVTAKFVCDVCGKEVKSALGLMSHKRSHTGVMPYANVEV